MEALGPERILANGSSLKTVMKIPESDAPGVDEGCGS
jgi:hypothetical protein